MARARVMLLLRCDSPRCRRSRCRRGRVAAAAGLDARFITNGPAHVSPVLSALQSERIRRIIMAFQTFKRISENELEMLGDALSAAQAVITARQRAKLTPPKPVAEPSVTLADPDAEMDVLIQLFPRWRVPEPSCAFGSVNGNFP